jgi:hypothetical protein
MCRVPVTSICHSDKVYMLRREHATNNKWLQPAGHHHDMHHNIKGGVPLVDWTRPGVECLLRVGKSELAWGRNVYGWGHEVSPVREKVDH